MKNTAILSPEIIEQRIFVIRGQKVMLDVHLAELYGVATKRLKEQVRRNLSRFPDDFMFKLTEEEFNFLRSQIATSKNWQWWSAICTVCVHRTGSCDALHGFE